MKNSQSNIHVLSRAVIRDHGHILVCKTLDLPKAFYFLPGGHIEHRESAEISLIRELKEEMGLDCEIERFLGCLEYSFEPGHSSICHNHEYNFIFEVESQNLKKDTEILSQEEHLVLVWMPIEQLGEIDFSARPLVQLIPKWLKQEASHLFFSEMV